MSINKDAMIDAKGGPITQGLFLETSYGDTKNVMYTLKSRDHQYKGKTLPSIKRLFLESEDPTEYQFAYKHFLDWDHWQRIKKNKLIAKEMKGWDEEKEVRMASLGLGAILDMALDDSRPNFQAAKFFAKREWNTRGAGRPSNAEVAKHTRIEQRISEDFAEDMKRMGL